MSTRKINLLLALIGLLLLGSACSPTQAQSNMPADQVAYQVISQGEAPGGGGEAPMTLALRGESEIPDQLPEEVRQALRDSIREAPDATYILIYAGMKPSGGYAVEIKSIVTEQKAGKTNLVVNYDLIQPDPQAGAAAVITYPFVIARLEDIDLPLEAIHFEGPELSSR